MEKTYQEVRGQPAVIFIYSKPQSQTHIHTVRYRTSPRHSGLADRQAGAGSRHDRTTYLWVEEVVEVDEPGGRDLGTGTT